MILIESFVSKCINMEVQITIKKDEIMFFIEALKLHEDDFEAQQRDLDYFMSMIRQRVEKKTSRCVKQVY